MRARQTLVASAFILCCWALAAPCRGQASRAEENFHGRAVGDATAVVGQTCTNPVIGFSYGFPAGMQVRDARQMRMAESRTDLKMRGIGPEAGYVLWGYGEDRTMAHVCGGESRQVDIQLIAIPQAELKRSGPNALQALVVMFGRSLGLKGEKVSTSNVAGRRFESAEFQGKVRLGNKSRKASVASFATRVNSYVLLWLITLKQPSKLKGVEDTLSSLKVAPPAPLKATAEVAGPKAKIEADFQTRLHAFLKAWLVQGDRAKTFSFVDPSAYKAPAIIGSYCDGWYKKGMPPATVRGVIRSNLMGVLEAFPKGTDPAKIFGAWNRLPPEWLNEAANDPAKDHFLVASLDHATLPLLFRNRFAKSQYEQYLEKQIGKVGKLYWVVFPEIAPDRDVFVIFTVWEKIHSAWSITGFDVICQ